MSGHFAHCSHFSSPGKILRNSQNISAYYVKPSNKVYFILSHYISSTVCGRQNDEPNIMQPTSSNGVRRTPIFDVPGTATSSGSSFSRYTVRPGGGGIPI